jgi:hypothetical protein
LKTSAITNIDHQHFLDQQTVSNHALTFWDTGDQRNLQEDSVCLRVRRSLICLKFLKIWSPVLEPSSSPPNSVSSPTSCDMNLPVFWRFQFLVLSLKWGHLSRAKSCGCPQNYVECFPIKGLNVCLV